MWGHSKVPGIDLLLLLTSINSLTFHSGAGGILPEIRFTSQNYNLIILSQCSAHRPQSRWCQGSLVVVPMPIGSIWMLGFSLLTVLDECFTMTSFMQIKAALSSEMPRFNVTNTKGCTPWSSFPRFVLDRRVRMGASRSSRSRARKVIEKAHVGSKSQKTEVGNAEWGLSS